jgi:apolipoprotein N-acyltransferase
VSEEPTKTEEVREIPFREAVGDVWWCLLSGVATFLAFPHRASPDSGHWWLAWFCLVPLFWVVSRAAPRRAFWCGLIMGTVTNFGGFWWIHEVLRDFGHLPDPIAWGLAGLNAAYQGLQIALFAYAMSWMRNYAGFRLGVWRIAALYTAVESLFPMLFPWYLGNCQIAFPEMVQVADLGGAALVTFTVVVGNGVVFAAIRFLVLRDRGPRKRAIAGLAWCLGVFVYGVARIAMVDAQIEEAETMRLGIIEADIGIFEKEARGLDSEQRAVTMQRNLLRHQRMSESVADQDVDLVIWPESSYMPLGRVWGKRSDDFAIGVGAAPQLALWREIDGSKPIWTTGPVRRPGAPTLRAVAAAREDAVLVGGDHGALMFWDGKALRPVPVGSGEDTVKPMIRGVAVTGRSGGAFPPDGAPVRLWMVGKNGALLVGTPERVDVVPSGTDRDLTAIAMRNSSHGVAVGDAGRAVYVSAGGGSRLKTGTQADLLDVWVDAQSGAYWAVGAQGTILRGDGKDWRPEVSPERVVLRGIDGTSPDTLWAVGDDGTVVARGFKGEWTKERVDGRPDLVAVSVTPRGTVLASDRSGGLWHRVVEDAVVWRRLDAPGMPPMRALASLPYVEMASMPKDLRHLYTSDAPVPDEEAFLADPSEEFRRPLRDRTALLRGFRKPVLFGALTWETKLPEENDPRSRRSYNTVVLLDGDGRVIGMNDKVFLLAFGETIPFGDTFPILYDWIPEASRFTAGREPSVIRWGDTSLGMLVCYEDILPRFAGDVMALEPDILINVTNDAWFGKTGEPYLHMILAAMRAVEHRRVLVRSTNTGVSVIVDPVGRIVQQTSVDDAEVLVADVPLMKGRTLYSRVGDVFGHGCVAWAFLVLLAARVRRRRT